VKVSGDVTAATLGAMRVSLIHGFAGDPTVWDATIAALDVLEAVAVALPGHGGGLVRDTWQANLDAIDLGDADLVIGYSLGARVALGLVAMGRIERAILISVNPGIDNTERAARRESDAVWARLLRERGMTEFVDAWQAQPLFATQPLFAPERLAERRARRLQHDPEQLARSLEVMGLAEMPDYRATVGRCALIAGAEDAKYVAIARAYGTVTTIPHCGHDPTLEQPTALAAAIELLARDRHGAPRALE
jgi:2-succinyl-6-hydroxy-2,4-cyclohexadiene-1-carboxylate synthase